MARVKRSNIVGTVPTMGRLLERQKTAARLMVAGMKQRDVANHLGMTETHLSIMKHNNPDFQEYLGDLNEQAVDKAVALPEKIRNGAESGVQLLLRVLEKDTEEGGRASLGQQIKVAQDLLNRVPESAPVSRSNQTSISATLQLTADDIREMKARRI